MPSLILLPAMRVGLALLAALFMLGPVVTPGSPADLEITRGQIYGLVIEEMRDFPMDFARPELFDIDTDGITVGFRFDNSRVRERIEEIADNVVQQRYGRFTRFDRTWPARKQKIIDQLNLPDTLEELMNEIARITRTVRP